MTATLTDFLLQGIRVEYADCAVIEIGAPGGIRFPKSDQVFFHLVLDGTVRFETGSGAALDLSAGDAVILLYGSPHSLRDAPDSPATATRYFIERHRHDIPPVIRFGGSGPAARLLSACLWLEPISINYLIRPLPDFLSHKVLAGPATPVESAPCGLAVIEAVCEGAGATAYVTRLADFLLIDAVRASMVELQSVTAFTPALRPILAALQMMRRHPETKWSVRQLASEVGMSRSCFAAAFKEQIGQPPMRYLTDVRMADAAEMLRTKKMSVLNVAKRVGYGSEVSFARIFKQYYGVTPGAYRGGVEKARSRSHSTFDHWAAFLPEPFQQG